MKKTLGGDRLGSGNKMTVHLHNYGRSTHNLSRAWRSTMTPGTLVPFMVEPILNGDTFDIDISAMIRTHPTLAPLFGSFKMQADVFVAPMRLYNRQLHNNKLGIGLDMSVVKFPQITLTASNPNIGAVEPNHEQINPSSLMAYLGIRGLGRDPRLQAQGQKINRTFNAMPLLAYWDIFKNYYANKQEENAFIIGGKQPVKTMSFLNRIRWVDEDNTTGADISPDKNGFFNFGQIKDWLSITNNGQLNINLMLLGHNLTVDNTYVQIYDKNNELKSTHTVQEYIGFGNIIYIGGNKNALRLDANFITMSSSQSDIIKIKAETNNLLSLTDVELFPFPLKEIDDMRERILSHDNNSPLSINNYNWAPWSIYTQHLPTNDGVNEYLPTHNVAEMAGLAVKAYQSDRFNNWLSTEWIEGANGIAEVTAVDTSSGSFTMDTLNLAQKVYNMLNRIAVSGGSYVDWQEAVWGELTHSQAETPIFMGSISQDVLFGEVTSTAAANVDGDEPLGSLAGKGYLQKNGRTIVIKAQEPSYIIGIISLTPRLDYSQGNKWWTRLETMNDLHKPALDGIGFQDLITDEMAAWDTELADGQPVYFAAGKQPAWIHYQTATNETFGNFAKEYAEMYMTLNRKYEQREDGRIKDITTYIDPEKYNYAFARTDLGAQNFWVQLGIDITARRKMSAKVIPNL